MTSKHLSQEIRENSRTETRLSLVLLLLCASFFALYNSNNAYTSDEVWSVRTATLSYSDGLAALKADVHPPLYFQILHSWISLFGDSERAVRSLSGLFYVMSVFAVYGLSQELYGKRTALLSVAIYASSPLAILTAQFARMYALLALLSILSVWLYLQFSIKPRDSRLTFALYIAVNILGTFTHIAFFFVLFAQIILHLWFHPRMRIKRFAVAILLSLLPYLFLWAPILLRQMTNSGEGLAWVKKPSLSMVVDLLFLYGGILWLIVPVFLYLWWRNGFPPFKRFSNLSLTRLPLWLLAVTTLTPLLISEVKPIFNSRFGIIGLPFFAITTGALIGRATNYFLPLALIILTAVAFIVVHPASEPCDNRTMADYLVHTANDGDVVIFTSLTRLPIDYYLQRNATTRKLVKTSFPAEIDQHPGFEGKTGDPVRRAALEDEAKLLIDMVVTMRSKSQTMRIFFFHGAHPDVDAIVERHLGERFELLAGEGVQCREGTPYFTELSIYR